MKIITISLQNDKYFEKIARIRIQMYLLGFGV